MDGRGRDRLDKREGARQCKVNKMAGLIAFRDVDHDARPQEFKQYLDRIARVESVRFYKSRVLDLLDLQPGQRVIEVGSGTGADSLAIATRLLPTGVVFECDRSGVLLQSRSAETLKVHRTQADVLQLPFKDGSADRCLADRVLQHVESPDHAVAEMARVTCSGGIVLICDTDWDTLVIDHPARDVTRAIVRHFSDSVTSGTVGRHLGGLLSSAGLNGVRVEGLTLTFQDAGAADQVLGFSQAALRAAEDGAIELEAAADWLQELEEVKQCGRFFAAVTGFAAYARK